MWMREVIGEVTGKRGLFSLELESADLRVGYPEHFLSHYTTLTQGVPIKGFVLTKVGHVLT